MSSKPKANRSEGRSSQLLLAFLFLGIRIAFPGRPPPPPRRDRNCALGPQQKPESVRAREGEAASPGDALLLQGEPLSVKYHQRQPRPHHFGPPNGIDRPSLTGYSSRRQRKKDEPGTRGRGGPAGGAMPLPQARDPREAGPARHPPAAEGRGVSCGRTARRDPPSGAPAAAADAHSARAHPAAAAAPGRMRKTDKAARRRRPRGRAPGRRTRPRAANADPRPRARPPASAPHLISGRVRAAAPRTNQCSPHAARRNAGSAAAHTIPARPPAPGRPGARSGCSLASRRTTEQPSCAPSPRRSSPLALLRSFAPSLPPISSSPSAASPPTPPTCQPSAPPTDGRG